MQSPRYLLLLLFLITIGFRIVHLDADPPWDFSWSGGYFADEGFWAHNARNAMLFNRPVLDDWDAGIVSPVFAAVQRFSFALFGPGLIPVRLVGLLSALVLSLSTFLILKRDYSLQTSFLAAAALAICYPMLVLARQGILDPFAAALAWLALLLLLHGSGWASFASGIVIAAALVSKYLMIYILAPFAVVLFSAERNRIVPFTGGMVVALAPWFVWNYLPNMELFHAYSRYYSSQQSWELSQVAKNMATQPFYLYFSNSPVLLFAGNLVLWVVLLNWRQSDRILKIAAIWLFAGIVFFAVWRYRPLRYYTSLLPALTVLAALAVLQPERVLRAFRSGRKGKLLWLFLLAPAAQLSFALADRLLGWNYIPRQVGLQASDLILFLLLTMFFAFTLWQGAIKRHVYVAVFATCFLLADVRSYTEWILQPRYSAKAIALDLQRRVGDGVLTGQWAPEMCLENSVRTVPVWHGFVNYERPFDRYGITHVLQWNYELGGEKFEMWYPAEFRDFRPVVRYRIKNSDVILFEKMK